MTQLNNSQINALCASIVAKAEVTHYPTFALFSLLYHTGARLEELLHNNTVSYDPNTHLLTYVQKKKQQPRAVTLQNTTDQFDSLFFQYIHSAQEISPRTAQNYFHEFIQGKTLLREDKPISTHIFRYNFARQLKDSGLSSNQVATALGHQNPAYALPYMYKPIFIN